MIQIPDAPWIRAAELNGYPYDNYEEDYDDAEISEFIPALRLG